MLYENVDRTHASNGAVLYVNADHICDLIICTQFISTAVSGLGNCKKCHVGRILILICVLCQCLLA